MKTDRNSLLLLLALGALALAAIAGLGIVFYSAESESGAGVAVGLILFLGAFLLGSFPQVNPVLEKDLTAQTDMASNTERR